MATCLGFDFGTLRVGVALGDTLTGSARALATIAPKDWAALDKLIREWSPHALVVGLPLAENGDMQPIARRAQRYARALEQRTRLPVYTCDERYSSLAADSAIRDAGKRSGDSTDAQAARIILEQWLSQSEIPSTPPPPAC